MVQSFASGSRTVEPIVLGYFVLDGEAERGVDGKYLIKSQQGWEQHYVGTRKRLPSVREYIITLKQLEERKDQALPGLLQDLREDSLATGVKIDYDNSNLPVGDGYLDELIKDSAWKSALEDEVIQSDAPEAASVLHRATGKRPYIITPSADGRKSHPKRAVWLDIGTVRSILYCYCDPFGGFGRSRGVSEVGAAGARTKKSDPAYQNPAMAEEQRLTARVEEELSRFDKYLGTFGQQEYQKDKKRATEQLLALLKK